MDFNKYFIMGRLTRDVQVSYTPNQTAVAEFGMATNRRWKGQDGHDNEEVLFVDCRMYGKRAVVLNKYVGKGDPLFIEGRLKLDQWEQNDGLKRSKIQVIVENFEFISVNDSQASSNKESQPSGPNPDYVGDNPSSPEPEDDIPF